MHEDLNRVDVAWLESWLTRKRSRSVRRGAGGKGRSRFSARTYEPRHKPYLASRLPYCPSGSGGGGWIPLVTRDWPPTSSRQNRGDWRGKRPMLTRFKSNRPDYFQKRALRRERRRASLLWGHELRLLTRVQL